MKKRVIALLLCVTTALAFMGCGTDTGGSTETEGAAEETKTGLESLHMDIDVEKQVTKLSDYEGIELTITGDYDVTDEIVENAILTLLPNYGFDEDITMDDLTDEMVADAFTDEDESLTSKDALTSYVRDVLETQMANYKNQAIVSAAEEYLIANSTVDIPDAYFLARLSEYEASFARDYCEDGETLEEFLTANGTSLEEMTEEWTESLKEQIQVEFLFGRIADLQGIEVEEDDFTDFVDYLVSAGEIDASTAEDVYDYYGNGNREDGEQSLRQLFRVNQAITYVVENAVVTIEKESED